MMADPPRLRSDSESLEALLLRSSRSCEPPPLAEDEVWRRVQVMTAAGAAVGATGLAVQTASAGSVGSKIAAGGLWLSVMKWTAVVAVALPATGEGARWALHRGAGPAAVSKTATPQPLVIAGGPQEQGVAPDSVQATPAAVVVRTAPKPAASPRAHSASAAESITQDGPSALRKESLSLGAARAKFAAGDARGALDEIARLGAEFPHGRLVQEREVLAMDCLAALGDTESARTRAVAFLGRFPASPYLAHVRQLERIP
jgi:hypothetical protein